MSTQLNDPIIIGIDPGLSITGYAIARIREKKTSIIDFGYFSFSSKDSIAHRVSQFYEAIQEKIKTYHVTTIALETPFLGKNVQSFLKLGYLRGVVYLLSQQQALSLHEFTPRQVKQAVTGSGSSSKEQVATVIKMMIPQLYTIKKTYKEDVTDALAICLCGAWLGEK